MRYTGNLFAPGAHFLTLLKTHLCKKKKSWFLALCYLKLLLRWKKQKTILNILKHKFISHMVNFQIYDDDLGSGNYVWSYQNRLSNGKLFPPKTGTQWKVFACVCVSVWTHMLVCPWVQRAFEPQALVPPIRISVGKGTNTPFNSNSLPKTSELVLISFSPFFVISSFSSLPCPHLRWSKITGRYQRCWNQSHSLLIVGTQIHYISTKVLSFLLNSTTSHYLFPPSLHTSFALSTPFGILTLFLHLFSAMWEATLSFP